MGRGLLRGRGLGHPRSFAAGRPRRGFHPALDLEPLRRCRAHALVPLRRQLESQGPGQCGRLHAPRGEAAVAVAALIVVGWLLWRRSSEPADRVTRAAVPRFYVRTMRALARRGYRRGPAETAR